MNGIFKLKSLNLRKILIIKQNLRVQFGRIRNPADGRIIPFWKVRLYLLAKKVLVMIEISDYVPDSYISGELSRSLSTT